MMVLELPGLVIAGWYRKGSPNRSCLTHWFYYIISFLWSFNSLKASYPISPFFFLIFHAYRSKSRLLAVLSHLSLFPICHPHFPKPSTCNLVLLPSLMSFLFFSISPHPFNPLILINYHGEAKPSGADQREVLGKLVGKHQGHSRDARAAHLKGI